MTSERFELTNSEAYLTMSTDGSKRGGGSGCYVSTALGFVLLFLALLISVGVGLIVHFAGGEDSVVCKCDWGGSGSVSDAASAALTNQCSALAEDGTSEICNKCPESTFIGITSLPVDPTTTATPKVTDVRLPDTVLPVHYNVELSPMFFTDDPEDFTYTGTVSMIVECEKATDTVSIHSHHLVVDQKTITFRGEVPNRQDPLFLNMAVDDDRQFIILKLSRDMKPGRRYVISMSYSAKLDDRLKGLYYSQYSRGNESVYIVTTQFQPTDARRAFPCFDEPALKATFNITLVRPDYLISLSNMPIIDNSTTLVIDGKTFVKDVYATTPKMSTYLLAFIVCDFKYLSKTTSNDVLYRAWATPDSVNQAAYALDVGADVLTYFEDFFNISYPLPKQDMIAIPDFAAGAMENWGLITYRETAMLYEHGVSNAANLQRIAIVVSHELAHQWFGDLVSPAWWDDLWLNEGFATFVEYLGVDYKHPDWNIFDVFALSEVQRAFYFDGLISSHPLYVPVGHPDEINEIFDTISYSKGASIIRMMRHFLGEQTFKRGLTKYLRRLQYGAARHDDLWAALSEQADKDSKADMNVKDIMDTWTLQMNYPVVTVTRDFLNLNQLYVRQERYLVDPKAEDPGKYTSPYDYRWTIPLTFGTSEKPIVKTTNKDVYWLMKDQESATLTLPGGTLSSTNGWILANIHQHGYYRVNYQLSNWNALSQQLKDDHTAIPVINRAQIIDDAWQLARAGNLPLTTALKTIEYIDSETAYVPWRAASSQTRYVGTMLSLTPAYGAFKSFMKSKLTAPFKSLGLDNTNSSHTEVFARELVASLACLYKVEGCRDQAMMLYRQWMADPDNNPIDVEIKPVIYCRAIDDGDWEEWKFALEMYKKSNVASEKKNLLSALGCSSSPWILNHYLQLILEDDSPIRKQDALDVIGQVADGTIGKSLAWDFFRANYDKLKDEFGNSFFSWTTLIGKVTSRFNTEFELQQLKEFRDSKKDNLGTGARAFEQALEKTHTNIRWVATNYKIVVDWLNDQSL